MTDSIESRAKHRLALLRDLLSEFSTIADFLESSSWPSTFLDLSFSTILALPDWYSMSPDMSILLADFTS